jgi:hypothetical protein
MFELARLEMPAASPAGGTTDQPGAAIEHHDFEGTLATQVQGGDAARLPGHFVGKRQADALGEEQHFVGRSRGARMIEQVAGRAVFDEQRRQTGQIDARAAGM